MHKTERGDHDFCLSRSHYTDTDPSSREWGGHSGDKTHDLLTRSCALYRLSYCAPPPPPLEWLSQRIWLPPKICLCAQVQNPWKSLLLFMGTKSAYVHKYRNLETIGCTWGQSLSMCTGTESLKVSAVHGDKVCLCAPVQKPWKSHGLYMDTRSVALATLQCWQCTQTWNLRIYTIKMHSMDLISIHSLLSFTLQLNTFIKIFCYH